MLQGFWKWGSSLKPVIGFAAVCDRYERIGKLLTKTLAVKRRLRPTTWFGTQKRPKRFALTGSRKSPPPRCTPFAPYASQTLVKGFELEDADRLMIEKVWPVGTKAAVCKLCIYLITNFVLIYDFTDPLLFLDHDMSFLSTWVAHTNRSTFANGTSTRC